MILTYIAGFLTPFALYGIYRFHLWFTRPDDLQAILDRLEYEKGKIIKQACETAIENQN